MPPTSALPLLKDVLVVSVRVALLVLNHHRLELFKVVGIVAVLTFGHLRL